MLALGGLLPAGGVLYGVAARPRINQWGATDQEHRATWPGDRLLARPDYVWTNAVTIERPAEQVWPWLVQLGQGRGGLYSYDWLENLVGCDIHSADRILPQFQQPLRVGDRVIRMARYAPFNPVARFEPGRALVLGGVNDADADLAAGRPTSTWAFIVHPVDNNRTRLLIRSRGSSLMGRIQGPIQFVMQRRAMVGIKRRAEGTWSPHPGRCHRAAAVVADGGRADYGVGQGAGPARAVVAAIHGGCRRHGRAARVAVLATADRPGSVVDGVLLRALIGSRRPRLLAAGGRRRR
jgi:hypothetical protein